MPLLQIDDLYINFGGVVAINSLSFSIEKGQIFGLIGPNGAGKTTVFNCIARYYQPGRGKIEFNGENILALKPHKIITKGIARTFQNMELFSSMTVQDNLLIGNHSTLQTNLFSEALALPSQRRKEREIRERAAEIMDFLGLTPYAHRNVKTLPYGVMKFVEMGRALMSKPQLILLDEPAAGMNHGETKELTDLIKRIRDENGITVLLIEHDMSLVRAICDEICVIDFGVKIAQGTADEISHNPKVIEAYLGSQEGE